MNHEPVVFFNGQFVVESQAKVSILDRGFRWGDAVYETLRTFGGTMFRVNEHLDRLHGSLIYSRIKLGMTMDELAAAMQTVVRENSSFWIPNDDYEVTIVVSRGLSEPTRSFQTSATVAIFPEPLDFPRFAHNYIKGIHGVTPATRRTPTQCVSPKAKIATK